MSYPLAPFSEIRTYAVVSYKQVLQIPHKSEGILFKPYCSHCLDTELVLTNSKLHTTLRIAKRSYRLEPAQHRKHNVPSFVAL